jgi:hypothetical protein
MSTTTTREARLASELNDRDRTIRELKDALDTALETIIELKRNDGDGVA